MRYSEKQLNEKGYAFDNCATEKIKEKNPNHPDMRVYSSRDKDGKLVGQLITEDNTTAEEVGKALKEMENQKVQTRDLRKR